MTVSAGPIGISNSIWRQAIYGNARSAAQSLLGLYASQGMAIDFTDNFFANATGRYGSVYVQDNTTPANNKNTDPYSWLTYTSPSAKLVLGSSGLFRYNSHNLYLNSESPANQSITVLQGATYNIVITGTVSITLSGATTGTVTAGTTSFTAASGTLTCGSTSGTGTVAVYRTPCEGVYLATTGSAKYSLPFEWSTAGTLLGIAVEEQTTNLLLNSSGGTGTWLAINGSLTANSIAGITGVVNATKFTEDSSTNVHYYAYNTTAAITVGKVCVVSWYVKPNGRTIVRAQADAGAGNLGNVCTFTLTGSGTVNLTGTGVTKAGVVALPNGWYRVYIIATATGTTANPYIASSTVTTGTGFETYTGDGVSGFYMSGAQLESSAQAIQSAKATSLVETFSATVTRARDNITFAASTTPVAVNSAWSVFTSWADMAKNGVVNYLNMLGDNGANDQFISAGTEFRTVTGSNGQCIGGSYTDGASGRMATGWGLNNAASYANNVQIGTDSTVALDGTIATWCIGDQPGGGQTINGHMSKIMLTVGRLTNTQLQTLSNTG